MAGTTWFNLSAGTKARASELNSNFDWSTEHIYPHKDGSTTDGVYDIGSSTFRFRTAYMKTSYILNDGTVAATIKSSGTVAVIGATSNHRLDLITNDLSRLSVDVNGNIAVGTTAAAYGGASDREIQIGVTSGSAGIFTVAGTRTVENQEIGRILINNASVDVSSINFLRGDTVTSGYIGFNTRKDVGSSGERMRIDKHGNVFIGTTTVQFGGASSRELLIGATAGSNVYLTFQGTRTASFEEIGRFIAANGTTDIASIDMIIGNTITSGEIAFKTRTDVGDVAQALKIDKNRTVIVGNTTTAANTSSLLELSGAKAMLISRLTTTQRDALTAVNGMMIYNSSTENFQIYENGVWRNMNGGIGLVPMAVTSTAGVATATVLTVSGSGRLRRLVVKFNGSGAGASPIASIAIDGTSFNEVTSPTAGTSEIVHKGNLDTTTTNNLFTSTTATTGSSNLDLYFKSSLNIFLRGAVGAAGDTVTAYIQYERS